MCLRLSRDDSPPVKNGRVENKTPLTHALNSTMAEWSPVTSDRYGPCLRRHQAAYTRTNERKSAYMHCLRLTSCDMPRPSPAPVGTSAPRTPPNTRNVAVVSHAEYVPTLTAAAALRVKAAVNKAAWWPWPLTCWPWKWCPSHVWGGLSLCHFLVFLGFSVLDLGPMYVTDRCQTSDVRQKHRLMPRPGGGA